MSNQQPPVPSSGADSRASLRQQLLAQRKLWFSGAEAESQRAALSAHLLAVLRQLEPECLGLYWPFDGEFNAVALWQEDLTLHACAAALPFAYKSPKRMEFRLWNGKPPELRDECGIPSCNGPTVVPDVILVPCLGYTRQGHRLGYGGGYFDRWLGQHPETVPVGLAWGGGEVEFEPQAHDMPMALVITELGVVA